MASMGNGVSEGRTGAIEEWSARWLAQVASRPLLAVLALTALVLALDLAGNLLLPPLDRTEVLYAQTAKQMLEPESPGTFFSPAFQTEPKYEKPLVVLWLQAVSAFVTGQVDQIRGYRTPSILGTVLAVLLTYWGARRLFDARVAFIGAALLATMLVVTVQATLAMPEALMLAATCAALFVLGRAYAVRNAAERGNAILFWMALGFGVLINVVTVPLIATLTALALVILDHGKAGWIKRLISLPGIIVFVILVSLWPLMLWQAGTLDAALAQWREEGLHLLLGPQEMKWRVLPGMFVVFLLLGMFPAGLFLGPAMMAAWEVRDTPQTRFLIAWIVPYLLFLELFTRKTPLYMVQAMLPPLAVLFAMWVLRRADQCAPAQDTDAALHERFWYKLGTLGWLLLVVGLVAALWALPFLFNVMVSPLAVLLGLATLALAVVTTKAMLAGHRLAAASSLVAMAVAFCNLTIPVTFAGLRPMWVSSEIRAAAEALRACSPFDARIVGYTEPSAVFELGTFTMRYSSDMKPAESLPPPETRKRLPITSDGSFRNANASLPTPDRALACVKAYDFIKGCSQRFTFDASGYEAEGLASRLKHCPLPERFRCENVPEKPIIGQMCE